MNKSTTHKIMINNTNQQLVVIKIDENKQNYKLVKKKILPLPCIASMCFHELIMWPSPGFFLSK